MNSPSLEQSRANYSRTVLEDDYMNELDPMLESGAYRIAFHRLCPFEVRQKDEDGRQFGSTDMLTVRIMASPNPNQYNELKLQISSEADLYMVYESKIDERKFERVKKMQNLNFSFSNFLPMLVKQFNMCDKFPKQYQLILHLSQTTSHQLNIIENIQYKNIELLSLEFEPIEPELKKQYILYRFSVLKEKNERIEQKTNQMMGLVKLKQQNLFQEILKKTNPNVMSATTMMSTSFNNSKSFTR